MVEPGINGPLGKLTECLHNCTLLNLFFIGHGSSLLIFSHLNQVARVCPHLWTSALRPTRLNQVDV